MTDAIETRYLLPPKSEASAFEETLTFIEERDEYELNEDGEDIMGRSRIHFSRDGFNIEITYDDISSKYPGGTLAKLRVHVARLGGTSDLDDAPDLWKLIASTTDIYRLLPQNEVAVHSIEPGQGPSVPVADGDVPPCDREFISWFDVYPSKEVEAIGRETLVSAPAPHVEELDDGSVLVVSKHPTSGTSLEAVSDHIGIPSWLRTDEETDKLVTDATWLIDQLRPFAEGGRYENLGRPTEFDIRDEQVIYLDLAQQEGSVGDSTNLLMQLLISLVYERAKETPEEVVFAIDESRYVLQEAANLTFLETVFRHHRHHDMSIRLITQTVDEFFEHVESEAILDQCAIKQFHRLDGMDETWADEFGLNYAQMRFVQNAVPGNDRAGYSEALVGVDGEWRGIEISALPTEKGVIDYKSESTSTGSISEQSPSTPTERLRNDGGQE